MSFSVALQSAAFYFLACTPCSEALNRRRAKRKVKEEQRERERRGAEQPDVYQQPPPFNMNPFWHTDMQMGPSLPKKGKLNSNNTSQKRLDSAGQDSAIAAATPTTTTRTSLATSNGQTGSGSERREPATDAALEDGTSVSLQWTTTMSSDDNWNRSLYQRPDEELWGSAGQKLKEAFAKAGESANRLLESTLGKDKAVTAEDRAHFYSTPKHPPVNDYHPPVVSAKPHRPDALQWMRQPPPPAKVMEGKMPVSRSASFASTLSRRTTGPGGSDLSLGRKVGERAVEAKLRKGELPMDQDVLPVVSPGGSVSRRRSTTPKRTRRRRNTKSDSVSTGSDGSSDGRRPRRKWPQSQLVTPEVDLEDEDDEYFWKGPETAPARAAQRPRLQTINSSGAASDRHKENMGTTLKSATEPPSSGTTTTKASPVIASNDTAPLSA